MTGLENAVLVTAAAGIGGTGLGGGAACLLRGDSSRMVSLLLSFAAGAMAGVVCFDLLGEAVSSGGPGRTAAGVLLGFFLTGGSNRILERQSRTDLRCSGLFRAGVVMALAIALHNLPEGMVLGAAFAAGSGGQARAVAAVIALHNIPEGMAVAVPLAAGGETPWRAAGLAALTGVPTVLGAVLGYGLGTMGTGMLTASLSLAAGAMLYVVFGELLPESAALWRGNAPALAAVAGILAGLAAVYG